MSTISFDPYRWQRMLLWQNRIARWCAAAAETTFHAVALVGLVAVALALLSTLFSRNIPLHVVADALARWPVVIGLATLLQMTLRQVHVLTRLRQLRADDWLGLQPIHEAVHRQHQRVRQQREALLQIALVAAAVAASGASWWWFAVLAADAIVAMLLAPLIHRRPNTQTQWNIRRRSSIGDPGRGRLWLWQTIEAGFAFRGRSLAGGMLILLLIPIGSRVSTIVFYVAAGLAAAWLTTAWNRSLAVLPAAQAWLAPQPLHGARLLLATCATPALLLLAAATIVAFGGVALGATRAGILAAGMLIALGILQFACVALERARPRRSGLLFALHLGLLLGVLQALPMLTPLLWLAQTSFLLRAAVRKR